MQIIYKSSFLIIEFNATKKLKVITIFYTSSYFTPELFIEEFSKIQDSDLKFHKKNKVDFLLLDFTEASFLLSQNVFENIALVLSKQIPQLNLYKIAIVEAKDKLINANLKIFIDMIKENIPIHYFETQQNAIEWIDAENL